MTDTGTATAEEAAGAGAVSFPRSPGRRARGEGQVADAYPDRVGGRVADGVGDLWVPETVRGPPAAQP